MPLRTRIILLLPAGAAITTVVAWCGAQLGEIPEATAGRAVRLTAADDGTAVLERSSGGAGISWAERAAGELGLPLGPRSPRWKPGRFAEVSEGLGDRPGMSRRILIGSVGRAGDDLGASLHACRESLECGWPLPSLRADAIDAHYAQWEYDLREWLPARYQPPRPFSYQLYATQGDTLWARLSARPVPMRPVWWGFALDSLLYAAACAGLLVVPVPIVRWIRRRRGRCGRCGYSRAGLAARTACPECGAGPPAPITSGP